MRRDFVKNDNDEPVWFHYMRISGSRKHVHRRTTEYYYVTEGSGRSNSTTGRSRSRKAT